MTLVRAKKALGQHFLKDKNIAQKIVDSLRADQSKTVLEIGPGMGILTQFIIEKRERELFLIEIDKESVEYLSTQYPEITNHIFNEDFLRFNFNKIEDEQMAVIGNFPYNISSQIFFKILEHRSRVTQVVGMLQKEVAERFSASPGSKTYGILSVLLQAFYNIEYLFTVPPTVFSPPPKVKSAVVRLTRNDRKHLKCDEQHFFRVVKMAFNQRRKTIRNSLKQYIEDKTIVENEIFGKRPEQLSVDDFVELTNLVSYQE